MATMKVDETACLDMEKGVIKAGKVCIVTGGNRGIGREIVMALAAAGHCKVLINHLPKEKQEAHELTKEVAAVGGEACCWEGSVTDRDCVQAMVKACIDKWGRVDVLVNNAGTMMDAPLISMTPEQWQCVLDCDLNGTFHCCQAVLKAMCDHKCGRIINITSVNGVMGKPNKANYMAAKAGMIGLTKSVAVEYASCGITCNSVAPGFVDAPMLDTRDEATIKQMCPMGRLGHPAEVAGLVRYLALDPSAGYITGQTIMCDGGMLMM